MVKGISRRVVVVDSPDQRFFEQAIFIVRNDAAGEGVTGGVLAYTDGLMCVENTFEKGAVGALHHHPHTQITYVVSGAFEFTVDGVTRTVHKGDTILKEDGVEHGCVCTEAGILLDIFTPMRDDFVK